MSFYIINQSASVDDLLRAIITITMNSGHKVFQNEIIEIIKNNLPAKHYKVFFFGSRANGTATERSDIDIGIEAEEAIPLLVLSEIKEKLENIRTLHKFDLVDFKTADPDFKEVASQYIEVIYEK